ncbi:hypothetical protein [Caballeronia sp. GAFFF1]|uniref:hypothetical protein n=1 Tax=Caballeronia sp. GAFFF1 TaxID=2921779 RepID=UPI002028AB56|nr:hypothetical protein [Caballeronia sp. GAFFF1]
MILLKHMFDEALDFGLRLHVLVSSTELRRESLCMGMPLLSSVCFFTLRLALSRLGVVV